MFLQIRFFLFSVCVGTSLYVCTCIQLCIHVHTSMWKPEVSVGVSSVVLHLTFTYSFVGLLVSRQGLLLNLELTIQPGWLASDPVSASSPLGSQARAVVHLCCFSLCLYVMCMGVWPECMSVLLHTVPSEATKGCWMLWNWVTDGCEQHVGAGNWTLSSLEEQPLSSVFLFCFF